MANCRIHYSATSIFVDYLPGNANFSYWLYQKVASERWKQTGEGIRLGCEVTEEEAEYIEKLALSQWGPNGCEVIGRPSPVQLKPRPIHSKNKDDLQLSLF